MYFLGENLGRTPGDISGEILSKIGYTISDRVDKNPLPKKFLKPVLQ